MRRFLLLVCVLIAALPVHVAGAAERTVRIATGNRFDPAEKVIEEGDRVRWRYDDDSGNEHTVTSDPSSGESFDSSSDCPSPIFGGDDCLDAQGESYEHRFDRAGTFAYRCKVHGSSMTGVIRVVKKPTPPPPSRSTPPPTQNPSVSPSPSPSPSPSVSPSASPSISPTTPSDGAGGGNGGLIALAIAGLAGLGGAGYAVYRKFIAPQ